jgi:hypothetical protein
MYIEQKLWTCAACGQPFAVQYACPGAGDDITLRFVLCPDALCGNRNPILMLLAAHGVVVKAIPGPIRRRRRAG